MDGTLSLRKCSKCELESPAANKFCGACGALLDPVVGTIDAYLEAHLDDRIDAIIKNRFAGQQFSENFLATQVAEKLVGWAKLFGVIVGIPIVLFGAYLAFVGIHYKTYLQSAVRDAQSDVKAIQSKLQLASSGVDDSTHQLAKLKVDSDANQKVTDAISLRANDLRDELQDATTVVAKVKGLSRQLNLQTSSTDASRLVAIASNWTPITDDLLQSCVRRNLISTVPSDCDVEKRASVALRVLVATLGQYFRTLQLKSANSSVLPGDIPSVEATNSLPGASLATVEAAKSLASLTVNFAQLPTDQQTISHLVGAGSPKLRALFEYLHDTFSGKLENSYEFELRITKSELFSYIQRQGVSAASVDCSDRSRDGSADGVVFLLTQNYCARLAALSVKQSALADFKISVETAEQALQQLANKGAPN